MKLDLLRMIFFLSASLILCTMYIYTGMRLIRPLAISIKTKKILWSILIFLLVFCFTPFIFWIFRPEAPWMDALIRIVFLQFGLFSILFPLVLFRDGILILIRTVQNIFSKYAKINSSSNSDKNSDDYTETLMNRKSFLANAGTASLVGFTTTLTGYGLFNALQPPEVKKVTVHSKNLPVEFEGFKIVQISDLHVGPSIKFDYVEECVKIAGSLNADIAVLTGDMVDGSVKYLSKDMDPIADLKTSSGIYLCTGNHEYYSGVDAWMDAFRGMGVKPLINEGIVLNKGKSALSVSGVTDIREGHKLKGHATNPLAALRNIPDHAYKVLLAHQPKSIFGASSMGYDLQLSGHTHGGQYFPYNYLVEFFHPYVSGLHKHGNTQIYVNTATGYWGPPQRMGRPGEITLIELRR
ncbi:MAG: metallophosphoesterase, partial [Spirochaetia bacterium]|nr:metallophosphoesterase [Spirochaetia bacterium]